MIVICDFGMGNLRSIHKAIEHLGFEAELTGDPRRVAAADRLILPGDAHFGDAMRELNERGLTDAVRIFVATGRPMLGICVGMQLLMEFSEEAPGVAGLGLIPGTCRRFQTELKVPHMGWNTVRQAQPAPIFHDLPDESYFYFIHSYFIEPAPEFAGSAAGLTQYSVEFPSILWHENIHATQFHPEKSQQRGLQLLRNFAAL
jgi:imidazole glycerol-phosphate synthase subunit HisH